MPSLPATTISLGRAASSTGSVVVGTSPVDGTACHVSPAVLTLISWRPSADTRSAMMSSPSVA